MEALQCAVAPLADRLERLADAKDAEALALQVIEQSKQLSRLVITLVRRVLAGQEGWDRKSSVDFVHVMISLDKVKG
jgi:hypothetical protein